MDASESTRVVTELFESSYSILVRYALRSTGSRDLAEDLVQEAFMLLYRDIRKGVQIDNPKAWTFCVIRRLISKQIRTHQIQSGTHEPMSVLDDLPDARISAQPAPMLDDITKLFSVLSRREEEVTILRMTPLKYKDIAQQLGIS